MLYPDPAQKLTYENEKAIYFYLGAFDALGNFSAHAIKLWGHVFPTVEHAFQWKKFEDSNPQWAERVLKSPSAYQARELGRKGPNMRPDWRAARIDAMIEIIRAKFSQHQDAREVLLKTYPKEIIENSPIDNYWGYGSDGKGQNQMGKILMLVRDELSNGEDENS